MEAARCPADLTRAMAGIAVVTDSAANIPIPLRQGQPLWVVPVTLQMEGRVLRDEVDISAPNFYDWFAANPAAPLSTSSPSPGEFLKTYQAALVSADGIVSIHIAARSRHGQLC